MSWTEKRAQFLERKVELDRFDEGAIRSLQQQINSNIRQYTKTAGISEKSNENIAYKQANANFGALVDKQNQYLDLLRELSQAVGDLSENADMSGKLQSMGKLQNEIAQMEKNLVLTKQDADTSRTRQESLEKPRSNLSWYQGFGTYVGFTRPLHQTSVPFLIGFGILLLFLSGLILREFFLPVEAYSYTDYAQGFDSNELFSFFTDARFYSVLAGITFVSVVLGILAWNGYLGKRLR